MKSIVALTTVDNRFNPILEFDDWFSFETEKGYNTCGVLARIAHVSDSLTDEENEIEKEKAIDELIKYDFLNFYKKVKVDVSELEK